MDFSAFLSVVEHGSVSAAAQALHLTQPAVSQRLASLETQLGVPLFDRIGKRLVLTDAGSALIPKAEEVQRAERAALQAAADFAGGARGSLRLATSHHIGLHRLAPILRDFVREHPQVDLDIQFEDSEAAHELIRDGHADLAVVTLDPQGPQGLTYEPIWSDPLRLVVAKDHPLLQAPRLSFRQLAEEPVILPGLNTYTGRIIVQTFAAKNLTLNPRLSTNYLETIGMLVAAGLGWSVLPETMISPELTILPAPKPRLARALGIVRHPERGLSRSMEGLRAVLTRASDAHLAGG